MPDIFRLPLRMNCRGIDLTHPIDRIPEGGFPYLFNARVLVEGRIDGRPGYATSFQLEDPPNSIRRLNDPASLYAPSGYTYVGGGGTKLYSGTEDTFAPIDTGYSGHPLSLIPFRPDQSPEAWMYVYDQNKQVKVRPDGAVRPIGVFPPNVAPEIEYGVPAWVNVDSGQSAAGWSAQGATTALTLEDRTNAAVATVTSILYNSGNTGWCCINPSATVTTWMGGRMQVTLGAEVVVVRDILPAIVATTVSGIQYDSGSDGLCSVVFADSPVGLKRNSLIVIDAEIVRVLDVILTPAGVGYSVRCSTTITHGVGEAVTGLLSWYCYTVGTHAAGDTIASSWVKAAQASAGVGSMQASVTVDASVAGGRPVDTANDYVHVSLYLENPTAVDNVKVLIALDATPNFSFDNPGNSLVFTLYADQLRAAGAGSQSWVELVLPLSSAVRYGGDFTRGLATITGLSIQMSSIDACNYGFDWWYLFGTYGPTVQPNSPIGLVYLSAFRDSSTGAHSVPSPFTRYELFPLRESVIITPETTTQVAVDYIDIYRQGGLVSSPLYVGSVANDVSTPASYTDALPDSEVLAVNQPPDLTALVPWPSLDVPWSGIVDVIGTSVHRVSGAAFNTALISGTVILISGIAYSLYGPPIDGDTLELTQSGGVQVGAAYQISSPTLTGQPLPYAFGVLEGPFTPVIFALGDPRNEGLLYVTNFNDADGASDKNTYEVSTPSDSLVSGAVWNGLCFAGSRTVIKCVRYTYLTGQEGTGSNSFQWANIPTTSGFWSRWSVCPCPIGVAYLGRDGIYIANEGGTVNISDDTLYPLFPHDGKAALPLLSGSNVIYPVDMSRVDFLRLSYCDETLRFSYFDTAGNCNTLIYEIYRKRWFLNNYANNIVSHYLVEGTADAPTTQEILMLAVDNNRIMLAGGDTDNGVDINTIVLLPALDSTDERAQKLYVDSMTQADGSGVINLSAAYNNAEIFSPVIPIPVSGSIIQAQQNLASIQDLSLYRNISAKFDWVGGPAGPRLYAWEPSGYIQPYLSKRLVTQVLNLSFPGWKHHRRVYPALISNSPVTLTIKCQDGRTFQSTIPSTGGVYRTMPFMLPPLVKDLAFAYELDGGGSPFAVFLSEFTIETKEWTEATYILLAVLKT